MHHLQLTASPMMMCPSWCHPTTPQYHHILHNDIIWHHNITPWSAPYHNECLTSQWHYCSTIISFWLHNESKLVNRLAPLELAPRTADPGPSIGPVYLFPLDLSMLTCPLALYPRSPIPWHHTICFGLLCLTSHYVIPFHHPHIMA